MEADARRFPAFNWLPTGVFRLWLAPVLAAYCWVQNANLQPVLPSLARSGGRWLAVTPSAAATGSVALDLLAAPWLAWEALGAGLWLLEQAKVRIVGATLTNAPCDHLLKQNYG